MIEAMAARGDARSSADGMVVCQRHFGRVERGDCVFHLAIDHAA